MMPDVHLFNPSCDYAIANGSPNWHPGKLLRQLELDLATLPVYLAKEGDYILMDEYPSDDFLQRISCLGIENRKFLKKKEIDSFTGPINRIHPWGWSPSVHRLIAPLKPLCAADFRQSPVFNWNARQKYLHSREFAASLLLSFVQNYSGSYLIDERDLPVACFIKSDVEFQLNKWGALMLKAPWSSSGRGLQKITKTPVHESVWQRVKGIIRDQGFIMAEPFLTKEIDLAFEYSIFNKEVKYLGTSFFSTDSKGQYIGNLLNISGKMESQEAAGFLSDLANRLTEQIRTHISKSELIEKYEGFLGIDALIYRDKSNRFRINPILELNLRSTMGIIALNLEKHIEPGKSGIFSIYNDPGKSFPEYNEEMHSEFPPEIRNNKLRSGFFPLTDFNESCRFGAYLLVEKETAA